MMCELYPIVRANFKAFGEFEYTKLARAPGSSDLGRVAALLLLAASNSPIKTDIVTQIIGFPEKHQANLQQVLKYAFSDDRVNEGEAVVAMLHHLSGLAEELVKLHGEHKALKRVFEKVEVRAMDLEGFVRDKDVHMRFLREEITGLSSDLKARDREINNLKEKLVSQEEEFYDVLVELKDELETKEDQLHAYQNEAESEVSQQMQEEVRTISSKLDEARDLIESMSEALKAKDVELENSVKMRGLLDFLNAQLRSEKQSNLQLTEEVEQLREEIDVANRKVVRLKKDNKTLTKASRQSSKRASFLNDQINKFQNLSLESYLSTEDDTLHDFTIDQNKFLEEQLIDYKNEIFQLQQRLEEKSNELNKASQENEDLKLKITLDSPEKRPEGSEDAFSIDNLSVIEDFETPRQSFGFPSENLRNPRQSFGFPSENFRNPRKSFGFPIDHLQNPRKSFGFPIDQLQNPRHSMGSMLNTGMQHWRTRSTLDAQKLKRLRHDETHLLRARMREQDLNIAQLLNEKTSLLVSLEHLSQTNLCLVTKNESLKSTCDAYYEAKKRQTVDIADGMKSITAMLENIENEVKAIISSRGC